MKQKIVQKLVNLVDGVCGVKHDIPENLKGEIDDEVYNALLEKNIMVIYDMESGQPKQVKMVD